MPRELSADQVRKTYDPKAFQCETTEDIKVVDGIIGQNRALSALRFGLNIPRKGFNIFVSGPAGTGRTTAIKSFVDLLAAKKPTPPDWCYVNNFRDPYRPRALSLPTGMGQTLQKDMERLIENVQKGIAQAFSSKEYADRRSEVTERFTKRRETAFTDLGKRAEERGLVLQATPVGLILVPGYQGRPMSEEEFHALGQEAREQLRQSRDELMKEIKDLMAKLRSEEQAVEKEMEDTDREVARYAIGHLFAELTGKYSQLDQVTEYLKEVEQDIVENFEQFKGEAKPDTSNPFAAMQEMARKQTSRKYEVNVLVDNSELKGAPVILEFNPTFQNLIGRIEKEAQFGALTTDFSMIKSGSLHRANGGYLVVRMEDILSNFQTWEGLKRTLREGKLVIEDIGERLGFLVTKTLRPEPVPLDAKVVVIGQPMYYYLLFQLDPEFKELFKVKADFDTRMDVEPNLKDYIGVVCRLIKEEDLRHLTSGALAKVIEHSSRLAGDQEKLSAQFADVSDTIRESNFWAGEDDSPLIETRHVQKTIEERLYRSNLIQQRINEMIQKDTIIINIEGENIGQVNGLEVLDLGDFAFGKPTRITASVGVGREGLVDIEREVKLGGPIHSKGVMILAGYLTSKYARTVPISLSARLVFEQSYQGVEGDSASSTELYTLLSALAEVPIKQSIAVTGSVNQKGEVQAIGGINEKIEGFFEVCKLKGLNGQQGAMIPQSNVKNLMLKEEVVEAVRTGRFHIYPVSTIDEGMEVLTGMKVGRQREDGSFEPDSINDRVQKRLTTLAERLRDFSRPEERVPAYSGADGQDRDQKLQER